MNVLCFFLCLSSGIKSGRCVYLLNLSSLSTLGFRSSLDFIYKYFFSTLRVYTTNWDKNSNECENLKSTRAWCCFFLLCGCACKPNAVARFSLFQRWEYKLGGFLWIFNYKAFSFSCNGDCWTCLSGLYTQVHSVHFQQHSVVALTLLRSIFYCMYCWKFTHTVDM